MVIPQLVGFTRHTPTGSIVWQAPLGSSQNVFSGEQVVCGEPPQSPRIDAIQVLPFGSRISHAFVSPVSRSRASNRTDPRSIGGL